MNAQNAIQIKAQFFPEERTISLQQKIEYTHTSTDTLHYIYILDWHNAYSSRNTPLAKRFEEEYSVRFHLAKKKEYGYTQILNLKNAKGEDLDYNYSQPDIIKIKLPSPLLPGNKTTLHIDFSIYIQDDKFTQYGVTDQGDYHLRYWYMLPVVYDGKWNVYSHKNLNDAYTPLADVSLEIQVPENYNLFSELDLKDKINTQGNNLYFFEGKRIKTTEIDLVKEKKFDQLDVEGLTFVYDLKNKSVPLIEEALIIQKVASFVKENLGDFPYQKIKISELDYKRNPIYGLNQLPKIISPFPENFQYEIKFLKTTLLKCINNVLHTNPRKDYWLADGLSIYLMMKYMEQHYPDTKLLGKLSDFPGFKWMHAADLGFNFQYYLYAMEISRKHRNQSLSISRDSLTKYNNNIAGKYNAAIGLQVLQKYAKDLKLDSLIKTFVYQNRQKPTSTNAFEQLIKKNTTYNIDWFHKDYLKKRDQIDYTISHTRKSKDSIYFTLQNKSKTTIPTPVSLYKQDSLVDYFWVADLSEKKPFRYSKNKVDKVIVNESGIIPEFNRRNNTYKWGKLFNRKLQLRLVKDIEDPNYSQTFFIPLIEFKNIYDGLTLGGKFANKAILRKNFNYKIAPQYGFTSKALTGSLSAFNISPIEKNKIFQAIYGFGLTYRSFGEDAFFMRFTPNVSLIFRDAQDLRSDITSKLTLRHTIIKRFVGESAEPDLQLDEPDYSVFNINFGHINPSIINYRKYFADLQFAETFGKLSFNFDYRKLLRTKNRLSLRFYGGIFLYNKNEANENYFNFALDRPTDYLFNYNYIGRSENEGFFSQQIIISEGGFKSKLQPSFANQWISTVNGSLSLWKFLEVYADVGYVKNKGIQAKFVYDGGIRFNLVEDYFEIFFPLFSNLGWEADDARYFNKVRFMFTIDPIILSKLFTRKWY